MKCFHSFEESIGIVGDSVLTCNKCGKSRSTVFIPIRVLVFYWVLGRIKRL